MAQGNPIQMCPNIKHNGVTNYTYSAMIARQVEEEVSSNTRELKLIISGFGYT